VVDQHGVRAVLEPSVECLKAQTYRPDRTITIPAIELTLETLGANVTEICSETRFIVTLGSRQIGPIVNAVEGLRDLAQEVGPSRLMMAKPAGQPSLLAARKATLTF
jgi:hypothetical protein